MKLYKAQDRDLTLWHNWFAWYPVQTDTNDVVWLEIVKRKFKWRGPVSKTWYEPEYMRVKGS